MRLTIGEVADLMTALIHLRAWQGVKAEEKERLTVLLEKLAAEAKALR